MEWTPTKKQTVALDPVEKAKRSIQAIVGNIDAMVDGAMAIVIKDDKSQIEANALAGSAKRLYKAGDARREELIKDPQGVLKKINSFWKIFAEKLEKVWKEVDRKDLLYSNRVELERRKQEELIRQKNEELQKELNKEAKKSGVAAPTVLAKPLPKASTTVRTEEGTSFWRDNWVGEVIGPDLVLRELCSPDPKKIAQTIKMGTRDSPGILIENRKIKSYRT